MEFSVNVNLTASPELLGTVNRLADAIMGFRPNLIKQDQTLTVKMVTEPEVAPKTKPVETTVSEPEVTNEEAVHAPQEVGETPKENTRVEGVDYVETELMEFPVAQLTEILKGYGINPKDHEGLNTNRKLRLLVLEAQKEAKGTVNEKTVNVVEEATPTTPAIEEKSNNEAVTLETTRALFVQKIQAGKRSECKAILEKYGCASVTELGETDHVEAFYNDLLKL